MAGCVCEVRLYRRPLYEWILNEISGINLETIILHEIMFEITWMSTSSSFSVTCEFADKLTRIFRT